MYSGQENQTDNDRTNGATGKDQPVSESTSCVTMFMQKPEMIHWRTYSLALVLQYPPRDVINICYDVDLFVSRLICRSISDNNLNLVVQLVGSKLCAEVYIPALPNMSEHLTSSLLSPELLHLLRSYQQECVTYEIFNSELEYLQTPLYCSPFDTLICLYNYYSYMFFEVCGPSGEKFEDLLQNIFDCRDFLNLIKDKCSVPGFYFQLLLKSRVNRFECIVKLFNDLAANIEQQKSNNEVNEKYRFTSNQHKPFPIKTLPMSLLELRDLRIKTTISNSNETNARDFLEVYEGDWNIRSLKELLKMPPETVILFITARRASFVNFIFTLRSPRGWNMLVQVFGDKLCKMTEMIEKVEDQQKLFAIFVSEKIIERMGGYLIYVANNAHTKLESSSKSYCSPEETMKNIFLFLNVSLALFNSETYSLKVDKFRKLISKIRDSLPSLQEKNVPGYNSEALRCFRFLFFYLKKLAVVKLGSILPIEFENEIYPYICRRFCWNQSWNVELFKRCITLYHCHYIPQPSHSSSLSNSHDKLISKLKLVIAAVEDVNNVMWNQNQSHLEDKLAIEPKPHSSGTFNTDKSSTNSQLKIETANPISHGHPDQGREMNSMPKFQDSTASDQYRGENYPACPPRDAFQVKNSYPSKIPIFNTGVNFFLTYFPTPFLLEPYNQEQLASILQQNLTLRTESVVPDSRARGPYSARSQLSNEDQPLNQCFSTNNRTVHPTTSISEIERVRQLFRASLSNQTSEVSRHYNVDAPDFVPGRTNQPANHNVENSVSADLFSQATNTKDETQLQELLKKILKSTSEPISGLIPQETTSPQAEGIVKVSYRSKVVSNLKQETTKMENQDSVNPLLSSSNINNKITTQTKIPIQRDPSYGISNMEHQTVLEPSQKPKTSFEVTTVKLPGKSVQLDPHGFEIVSPSHSVSAEPTGKSVQFDQYGFEIVRSGPSIPSPKMEGNLSRNTSHVKVKKDSFNKLETTKGLSKSVQPQPSKGNSFKAIQQMQKLPSLMEVNVEAPNKFQLLQQDSESTDEVANNDSDAFEVVTRGKRKNQKFHCRKWDAPKTINAPFKLVEGEPISESGSETDISKIESPKTQKSNTYADNSSKSSINHRSSLASVADETSSQEVTPKAQAAETVEAAPILVPAQKTPPKQTVVTKTETVIPHSSFKSAKNKSNRKKGKKGKAKMENNSAFVKNLEDFKLPATKVVPVKVADQQPVPTSDPNAEISSKQIEASETTLEVCNQSPVQTSDSNEENATKQIEASETTLEVCDQPPVQTSDPNEENATKQIEASETTLEVCDQPPVQTSDPNEEIATEQIGTSEAKEVLPNSGAEVVNKTSKRRRRRGKGKMNNVSKSVADSGLNKSPTNKTHLEHITTTAEVPKVSSSVENQQVPILKEEIQEEPILKEEIQEEPILKEEIQEEPILKKEIQEEPILKEEIQEEQILKEEIQEEPILKEEIQEEQILKEEMQEEPILKEVIQEEPILKAENQQEPILKQESQQAPVLKEENQEEAILKEENQQAPILKEENQQAPILKVENQQVPVLKAENQQKPIPKAKNQQAQILKAKNQQAPVLKANSQQDLTLPIKNDLIYNELNQSRNARSQQRQQAQISKAENHKALILKTENQQRPILKQNNKPASILEAQESQSEQIQILKAENQQRPVLKAVKTRKARMLNGKENQHTSVFKAHESQQAQAVKSQVNQKAQTSKEQDSPQTPILGVVEIQPTRIARESQEARIERVLQQQQQQAPIEEALQKQQQQEQAPIEEALQQQQQEKSVNERKIQESVEIVKPSQNQKLLGTLINQKQGTVSESEVIKEIKETVAASNFFQNIKVEKRSHFEMEILHDELWNLNDNNDEPSDEVCGIKMKCGHVCLETYHNSSDHCEADDVCFQQSILPCIMGSLCSKQHFCFEVGQHQSCDVQNKILSSSNKCGSNQGYDFETLEN